MQNLSIVFIHGLEGDRELTWTFGGANNPWPESLLPVELPDCRLLTFGYDATYIGQHGQVSMNRLRHHAMNLLNTLGQYRERDDTDDRPIIFVAHCLGGLVCKEALVKARNSQESRFQKVSSAARGVAFLGTPHRGSDVDPWLDALAWSLKDRQTLDVNREITEVLRPDSEVLFLIESDFASMIRRDQKLQFCCFVAERRHEQYGMPVSPHLGIMHDRNYMTIASDHIGMTKFANERDPGFLKVSGELRQWLKHLRATTLSSAQADMANGANNNHGPFISDDRLHTILESLRFDQMDARLMTIKTAHAKTCRWLLRSKEYLDWLDETKIHEHLGFLWIKAKAGAGKSTAMKFLLRQGQSRKTTPGGTVISFFFNARGEVLERTVLGMYRHILLQLFERRPETRHILGALKTVVDFDKHPWTVGALQDLLGQAILSLTAEPMLCYVDALDECDEEEIRDMIELFQNIAEAAIPKGIRFKLCFASRLYPRITMDRNIDLQLVGQEGHDQDIANYIQSNLVIGKSKLAESIRATVKEKASGVFMWVVLVVRMLQEEHDKGNIHALRVKLDKIPKRLHELFEDILTRDDAHMDKMLLCLQWVLFARTPLSPEELYYAILSGMPNQGSDAQWRWDPAEITPDILKNFILTSSKGLAEVTKSKQPKVQFIHESVRDFLLKEEGLGKVWNSQADDFEGRSHDQLKQCCQRHLIEIFTELSIPEELPRPKSEDGKKLRSATSSAYPFITYACRNLLYHADCAQRDGVDQIGFLNNFPLQQWICTDNLFKEHEIRRHTLQASLLYILAEQNSVHLIKIHPSAALCLREELAPERYGTPFFAAAATGSEAAQLALIDALAPPRDHPGLHYLWCESQRDINRVPTINEGFGRTFAYKNCDENLLYGFALAQENNGYLGKFLAVRLLQCNAADPDLSGRTFTEMEARDSCNAAGRPEQKNGCLTDHVRFFGLLRQHFDRWFANKTPIFTAKLFAEAVKRNDIVVVRSILASRTVDVEKVGSDALLSAAAFGHIDIARLLLEEDEIQPDREQSKFGQVPLFKAIAGNHWEIARLLVNTPGVNIDRSYAGRTPLSHAAEHGQEDLVRDLLATGRVDINPLNDHSSHSPLLYAAENGHQETVRLLLKAANMDPGKVQSQEGLLYEVTRLLIETRKVPNDVRGWQGYSWLSRAAQNGNLAMVRLLIHSFPEGVDDAVLGATPLSRAAQGGHVEVVRLLLSTGQIDLTAQIGYESLGNRKTVLEHLKFYEADNDSNEMKERYSKIREMLIEAEQNQRHVNESVGS